MLPHVNEILQEGSLRIKENSKLVFFIIFDYLDRNNSRISTKIHECIYSRLHIETTGVTQKVKWVCERLWMLKSDEKFIRTLLTKFVSVEGIHKTYPFGGVWTHNFEWNILRLSRPWCSDLTVEKRVHTVKLFCFLNVCNFSK